MARPWRGGGGRRARPFEKGQFKYIVLRMLSEQPRHGYDIIRACEERFGGRYTPSAGVLYPTLQMLEDQGYVQAREQDGRKVYAVTPEGQRFLAEQQAAVSDAWANIEGWAEPGGHDELHDLVHQLVDLGHILGDRGHRRWVPPEKVPRIREVVTRAQRDIETILAE
jgi:DNA-binding PadR family transcriptional regulator